MIDRYFYGTNLLVDNFVKNLAKIETLDGGWTVRYVDRNSGQEWLKYSVDPDRGVHFNLMLVNPALSTDQLINIALTSKHQDEISAAAHRLHLEEQFEEKEFRRKLVDRLMQIDLTALDQTECERIRTIVQAANLLDVNNNREILGKHIDEINSDSRFFHEIAAQANAILAKLNN